MTIAHKHSTLRSALLVLVDRLTLKEINWATLCSRKTDYIPITYTEALETGGDPWLSAALQTLPLHASSQLLPSSRGYEMAPPEPTTSPGLEAEAWLVG